jgi:hypothetical protein
MTVTIQAYGRASLLRRAQLRLRRRHGFVPPGSERLGGFGLRTVAYTFQSDGDAVLYLLIFLFLSPFN